MSNTVLARLLPLSLVFAMVACAQRQNCDSSLDVQVLTGRWRVESGPEPLERTGVVEFDDNLLTIAYIDENGVAQSVVYQYEVRSE